MGFVADLLGWSFLLGGVAFLVVGGIGIIRMPDVFTRMHAASVTDTMGAGLLLAGLMVQAGWSQATVKLVLIFAFLLFTSPTATHALAQAALADRVRPRLDEDDAP